MEVLQIFLLFLIACFGSANWCYMGDSIMDRPIIISSLVGLVLGDFKAGLIIGGQLELAWIGIYAIGVSLPFGCCERRHHRYLCGDDDGYEL